MNSNSMSTQEVSFKEKLKQTKIQSFLKPLITVALLFLIFKLGLIDINKLSETLKNPLIIASGLFIFTLHSLVFSIRWSTLIKLEKNVSLWKSYQETLIGNFFNFFIPSGVGGDVVKALTLSENTGLSKKTGFSFIMIDRILGLYSLILFATVFLSVEFFHNASASLNYFLKISYVLLFLGTAGLFFLGYSKKITAQLEPQLTHIFFKKFFSFTNQLHSHFIKAIQLANLSKIIFISFVGQCLSIGFILMITRLFAIDSMSIWLFLPLACFAFMASAIPLTPAGLGVGQAAFYYIFSLFSPSTATSVTIGVSLMQFFMLITSLPGGIFFALSKKK